MARPKPTISRVNIDMKRIAEKTKRKLETVAHEFTQDMAEVVVKRTPVKTGWLRGHWFAAINTSTDNKGSHDPTGQTALVNMTLTIGQAKVGDTIYVLNNTPYADYVENGTVKMAPRGFVKSTVNDAPQIAEQTISRIAKT